MDPAAASASDQDRITLAGSAAWSRIAGRRWPALAVVPRLQDMSQHQFPVSGMVADDALLLVRRVHVDFLRMHICGC